MQDWSWSGSWYWKHGDGGDGRRCKDEWDQGWHEGPSKNVKTDEWNQGSDKRVKTEDGRWRGGVNLNHCRVFNYSTLI